MSSPEYEQLVRFLGPRFDTIDRHFETIDRRSETIDRRLETIDRRFDSVDRKFDELRAELLGHFDEIYRRLERLEQEYQAITQALRRIEARLGDERGRREILERDLTTLRENVAVLSARIEAIEQRLRSSS
jgi:chromosome segregation ATPase